MSSVPLLALFAFAAVLNSAVLGVVLLWRGRRTHLFWMGWMFLAIGFLLAVYALEHYDRLVIVGWLRVAYDLVSILLSCFLVEYVFGGLLRRRPHGAIYGSIIVYLIALAIFRGSFLAWLTIEILVLVQSFYTALALVVCLRAGDIPWKSGRLQAFALMGAFLAVHAAHLLRMFLGGPGNIDVAPIIGIVALTGMTSYALTSARFAEWVSPRPRLGAEESRRVLKALDQVMTTERVFVQPQLDLPSLARAVGTTPQNLSAALNAELGKTFYEYVTAFRVREAQRLLRDPDRSHLSLEAIGTESGFKSRSSFYSAFKNATGSTPGEHRKAPDS